MCPPGPMNTNTGSSNMTYGELLQQLREKSGAARFDNLRRIFDSLQEAAECNDMPDFIDLLKYTGSPDTYDAPDKQDFNHIHDATSATGIPQVTVQPIE